MRHRSVAGHSREDEVVKTIETDVTSDDWQADWEGHRKWQLTASMAATPAQRLAWLEEAIRFAWQCGAMQDMHNAEILSIAVDRSNHRTRLDFCLDGGMARSLELRGVKAFRCEDLTLQNVVNQLRRSSRNQLAREDLVYWLDWVTRFSDSDSWLDDEHRDEWLRSCQNGILELVVIEPSAGAQVAALCEEVVLI